MNAKSAIELTQNRIYERIENSIFSNANSGLDGACYHLNYVDKVIAQWVVLKLEADGYKVKYKPSSFLSGGVIIIKWSTQ